MSDFTTGSSELGARLEAFKASLPSMTDEELFQTLHSIEREKKDARAGNGEGESEDLLLKGELVEVAICIRHPDEMMRAYEKWLKTRL
ncbi:MAG: hypothetical protein ABSF11_07720 [Methylocella sp.]|jgi:hypothetical protein